MRRVAFFVALGVFVAAGAGCGDSNKSSTPPKENIPLQAPPKAGDAGGAQPKGGKGGQNAPSGTGTAQ